MRFGSQVKSTTLIRAAALGEALISQENISLLLQRHEYAQWISFDLNVCSDLVCMTKFRLEKLHFETVYDTWDGTARSQNGAGMDEAVLRVLLWCCIDWRSCAVILYGDRVWHARVSSKRSFLGISGEFH